MPSVRPSSTNDELETSKEELQSVNEELHTVNTELNSKIDELDRTNTDLRNLFESTQIATVLLDGDLIIRSFTGGHHNLQFDLARPGPAAHRHLKSCRDRRPGA
jgi:hypothetical protein